MLGQLLRRRRNFKPTLGKPLVSAGILSQHTRHVDAMLIQCWTNVYDPGPT